PQERITDCRVEQARLDLDHAKDRLAEAGGTVPTAVKGLQKERAKSALELLVTLLLLEQKLFLRRIWAPVFLRQLASDEQLRNLAAEFAHENMRRFDHWLRILIRQVVV